MNLKTLLVTALALVTAYAAQADPIHAIADGEFWHHDSGWVFPPKVGDFLRVGIPQDVAGSRDAVAYYARGEGDARALVSVEILSSDGAAEADVHMTGRLESEDALPVGTARVLQGRRSIYAVGDGAATRFSGLYVVGSGEWRARIRFAGLPVEVVESLDAFARGQRWESLSVP